ncbi:MAG TPA: hypothetical protein VHP11_00020 [Tepidisphaeraceae bacterium]|nr:hypothetical protein [Tepidisphaeraceae bacterium]
MQIGRWSVRGAARFLVLGGILLGGVAYGTAQAPATVPVATPEVSKDQLVETREQLISLLRMSPTLATVMASDPSLLANQEYVARSNPELARFLTAHPEIARNPDFYLFADITASHGRRVDALQRKLWPDRFRDNDAPLSDFMKVLFPSLGFLVLLGSFLWLIRTLIDNRRWGRIFKMQSEVHSRLIERFSTNEELLGYMGTEAGKRFLEASPIPVDFERDRRVPAVLSRVLLPLQAGIVLTLLGAGLLGLRHSLPEIAAPLLVFGMVVLMPGVGLVLSAGITWVLAGRLGLMPKGADEAAGQGGRL